MTTTAAPSRPSLAMLAPVAVTAVALAWAFWTTFVELAHTWSSNPQYSHGWLVPAFAAFLLWTRRAKLDLSACKPSMLGLVLVALGVGIRLFATYKYYVSLEPMALIPCAAGLVLLFGGWAAVRWAWPAVLFLAFMIPLPFSIATAMAGPLQRFATVTSTFIMQTLGMPALAEGNVILLNEHSIGVVEACSGLRMLVVFVALSTGIVLVVQRHWLDKTIIMASAIPIAILSNLIRVASTGILYEMGQAQLAQTFFHDVAGWLMPPLALAMLWIELKVMSHLFIDAPANATTARPAVSAARRNASRPAAQRTRRTTPAKAKPTTTPTPVEQPVQQNG